MRWSCAGEDGYPALGTLPHCSGEIRGELREQRTAGRLLCPATQGIPTCRRRNSLDRKSATSSADLSSAQATGPKGQGKNHSHEAVGCARKQVPRTRSQDRAAAQAPVSSQQDFVEARRALQVQGTEDHSRPETMTLNQQFPLRIALLPVTDRAPNWSGSFH